MLLSFVYLLSCLLLLAAGLDYAIERCGHDGTTTFASGTYNITRKMTWDLQNSRVDLHGFLSFVPDIEYWLQPENTYRVVFIQSQASWFVVTGSSFVINAHGEGGIQGNGQPWWDYFTSHTREDGDGRPLALTLWNTTNARVTDFHIDSQPFWCNTVAESQNVVYHGMTCNATNTNPDFFGQNIVPNTDGINTYRSDNVSLIDWDITCGDDCVAVKGNTSHLLVKNILCRGGNGIAIGSLGQYANMSDVIEHVRFTNVSYQRLSSDIQPNMNNGLYVKTWTGTQNGDPPVGGGGGGGHVRDVSAEDFRVDGVEQAVHFYQTNGGHSGDEPSQLMLSDLSFVNWTGTLTSNSLVDFACSPAVGCANISFETFEVEPPAGDDASYTCENVSNLSGLPAGACDD